MFLPRNFVGLDIGTTSVKVTRFQRGLTGPDEIMCRQQSLLKGDAEAFDAETVTHRLQALFQERPLRGVPVVVAMQTHCLFSRVLTIPFTDPKKVAQVIPYETEELIPLGLDHVVLDHTILDVRDGESTVLVTAIPHDRMAPYLELLANAGIDPVLIDLDSLSLFHFYRYALVHSARDIVLIDIGASRSTLCLVRGGTLRAIRSIMIGGETLTRKLAAQRGWTHATAEAEKQHLSVPVHESELEATDPSSNALRNFLHSFTIEVQNTIQAHEAATDQTISHLYLCGGGAKLNGLSEYLARRFHVQVVDPLNGRFGSAHKKGDPWNRDLALSLGLAVRPALWGQDTAINLRRGPFSMLHGERSAKQKHWIQIAVGVALLAGIGFANFYVDYSIKETRLQTLKDTLSRDFRASFPDITAVVDPIQQGRMALDQAKQRLAVFGHNDPGTVLLIVAELTTHLPDDRAFSVRSLTVEGATLKLEASTDSFEAVDAIQAAFMTSARLTDVMISDARMGAAPGEVRFQVTALVTPE